jgi:hypothetical protein
MSEQDGNTGASWVFAGYDSAGQPIYTTGVSPSYGGPGGMQPYYTATERLSGMQPGSLAQYANVESGGDPSLTNDLGYMGLFQFGRKTANEVGLKNPYDPYQSTDAAARYAQSNLAALARNTGTWNPATGLPYDGFDTYMAHQQGANGYGQLLAAGYDTPMNQLSAGRQANAQSQSLAGYNPNTWTVGDFLGTFQDRYNTASNGQPWGNYSYSQPFADSTGYPLGFGGSQSSWGSPSTWNPQTGLPYGYGEGGGSGFGTAYGGGYSPYGSGYAGGAGGYGSGYGYGGGGFGQFGMGTPSTAYGVDNSTYNSINQMMPGIGGAAQWGTPQQQASLNFTVGGPTSTSDPRTWDPQTGRPYGEVIGAPSAASLNGFGSDNSYGYGGGSGAGYGYGGQGNYVDPYNGAVSNGSDVYNMASSASNSLAAFGAANTYAAAQNQASSDALSNYYAGVAANAAAAGQNAFNASAPGQIQGYNPFTTQYQAY